MNVSLETYLELLAAGLEQDGEKARAAGLSFAHGLEARGSKAPARRVRAVLASTVRRPAMTRLEPAAAGLFRQTLHEVGLSGLVLAPAVRESLEQVLAEQAAVECLLAAGLEPAKRVLLVGPPGTGKTSVAAAFAAELRLPLLTVRLSEVVGSHLGETGKRLTQVAEALTTSMAVVLLDEVDAVGRARVLGKSDAAEVEKASALNAFLQALDAAQGSRGLLVAATNLPEALDRALLRRFDVRVELGLPTAPQLAALLAQRLALVPGAESIDWLEAGEAGARAGLSHADALRLASAAAKRCVLADTELSTKDFVRSLEKVP